MDMLTAGTTNKCLLVLRTASSTAIASDLLVIPRERLTAGRKMTPQIREPSGWDFGIFVLPRNRGD